MDEFRRGQSQELLNKQANYELLNTYFNAADRHDNEKMWQPVGRQRYHRPIFCHT